jgi:bifunctional DNA-binding transcriptional regulator/antitoxin component of YhaV-PrlF toxin-antitoxin module
MQVNWSLEIIFGKGGFMRFHTTILQSGKTATGIVIPAEIVESLGSGKKPPVRVTINGYTYRSTVATVSGQFMVGVSAEVRERAGVAGGDKVDVDIELDTAPREVTVPPDFAEALDREVDARRNFDSLSYSHKQQHVLAIEQAKTAETRQRRIEKAISTLREGRA